MKKAVQVDEKLQLACKLQWYGLNNTKTTIQLKKWNACLKFGLLAFQMYQQDYKLSKISIGSKH